MSGSSYPYHFIFIVFIKGFIMEEILSALVGAVNQVLWDYLLIYALIGIGLFFTLYLGAPQVTKLGTGFKSVFGGLFSKKDKDHEGKSLSQFQALAVAISAQIGTGNVAGVATAITAGGPGAIFGCGCLPFWACLPFLQKLFWRKNTAWSATENTSAALRFTSRTA